MLQTLIKVRRSNLVSEVAIRFRLELIHHNPKNPTSSFTCATARSLHDTKVATGADGKSRLRQELANLPRLSIFGIRLSTLRAAENGYDTLLSLTHCPASARNKSEPACR